MPRFLALLLLTASAAAGAADTFAFTNEPGPWPVGVQVKAQYDTTRVYLPVVNMVTGQPETHERARPIQSITWYPAKSKGKPLTWRDYMASKVTEDAFVAYDCRRGECGHCYTRVLGGTPLHRDVCLTPGMRAQGMCTCVSWAAAPERLVLEL